MLMQYNKKITRPELRNATFITLFVIPAIFTLYNAYQDTINLKHKTYRIKKLKFKEIHTKIIHKLICRLDSQHRTEKVPKTYRNPKKRTKWYFFKDQ